LSLEKASEIGAHILSGNVFETRALDELLPNWRDLNAPVKTKVSKEKFLFLGKTKSLSGQHGYYQLFNKTIRTIL
jgi:electron-transferring-flavoprotein dehydrogenase